MEEITIDAITEGQVLAEPVRDDAGRPLLEAGTALDAGHRDLLARRGVKTVTVRPAQIVGETPPAGAPGSGGPAELADVPPEEKERRARIIQSIHHAFETAGDDPAMAVIKKLALERAARGRVHD